MGSWSSAPGPSTHEGRLKRAFADQVVIVGLACAAVLSWKFRIIDPPSLTANYFTAGDLFAELYPMWHRAADWMRAGTLPLWNPFQLCGHPFLATLQYGIFYPLNVPVLLLPTALAIECVTVLHLVAAGTFTYCYGRTIQLTRTAAVAAGITFMWSGFITNQAFWFMPALGAAVWLPLSFLATEKLFQGRDGRWMVLFGVAFAMPILSGYLQTWSYSMYALGGYISVRVVVAGLQRSQRRHLPTVCARVALGTVLGAGLAAVQLLPTAELQLLTPRRPGGLSLAQTFPFGALPPQRLLAEAVGATASMPPESYVGMVPLILLPLAVLVRRGRLRVLFLAGLAVGSFTVALTVHTPLFALFRMLPAAAWFRVPWRILFLYAFAMAVLTGASFDVIALRADDRVRPRHVLTLAVTTAVGLAWWLWRDMPDASRIYLSLGAALVCAAVALPFPTARRLLRLALLSLLIVDLFTATRGLYRRPYHGVDVLDAEHETFDFIAAHQGLDRTYIHNVGLTLLDWSVMAKQGTLRGIYSVTDYEPLSLERTANFFRLMESAAATSDPLPFNGMLDVDPSRPQFRLLSLLSVRYIVTHQHETSFHRALEAVRWRLAYRPLAGRYLVYESPEALPRAYVAHDVISATDEAAALHTIAAESFDATTTVVIEADAAPAPSLNRSDARLTTAAIVRYDPTHVVIEADASRPGYLVLTDTFYPGWTADVDGTPQPIDRANSLFRAVPVAAGHHTVTFVYRPRSFAIGALITLAAVCSMVCVGAREFSRTRRSVS